jgi:hypothetical protein
MDFYRKWCEDIYGPGIWAAVKRTNNEFGGLHIDATNLILTNGFEGNRFNILDPWKWASLQQNYKHVVSKVAKCANCAHCVDLHAPAKTDSKELTTIRDYQLTQIKAWIKK